MKKLSKYETDLQRVNEILTPGRDPETLTALERLQLLQIYGVSYHKDGKIEGCTSCDASAHGCEFCSKMRAAAAHDPTIICGICYDYSQEEYRTSVLQRHALNLRIMKSVLFTVDELKALPIFTILRVNSSGDIDNVTQARNMLRIAAAHPSTPCTIWTKNIPAMTAALDLEGKPGNVTLIRSSLHIDRPDPLPPRFDYVFTVYSTPARVYAAIAMGAAECNGKKCRECGYKCYYRTHKAVNIAEYLRTDNKTRAAIAAATESN